MTNITTPDTARAAVAAAEAAFSTAVAKAAEVQFSNLAAWVPHNLIVGAVEPYRARIRAAADQLRYAPVADVAGSIHGAIVDAANDMAAVCRRISEPATMRNELGKLYRQAAPGSMMACPFRAPVVPQDGDIVDPHRPAVIAHAALVQWKARGIRVERVGDDLTLTGDVHAGDLQTARDVKQAILAMLPQPLTV
jgi:hypothetical protein